MAEASAPMIADAAERLRALEHTRSFIVQAPAGSGKTTLLVDRYLKLLSCVSKPEEIVAITFTRKAAAEMRRRVLEKLRESTAPARSAAEIAHRLRIETIDAFCASIARQLPVPAAFGVPPGIVDKAEDLYREAAASTLALLDTREHGDAVAKLLSHLDNNMAIATSLLAGMLEKRDQWLRKTGGSPRRAELEAAFAAVRKRHIDHALSLDPRASEEFAREVITRDDTFNRSKKVSKALEGNEALRLALIPLKNLPPEKYSEAQWAALEAMLALLPVAAAQLKLVFAAHGEADFTEVAQGAVRALGSVDDPSDLLLKLDQKISHLLVDEFQDTSISQWELLVRLTSGWEPGDGRTLFVVGDPMQSIYRFREAEVALFLRAGRVGLPNVKLEALTLRTNFRSQQGLVEFFNTAFAKVLPEAEDEASGAVPYSRAAPHHPALPGPAATWHCFPESKDEAREIVEIVRAAEGTKALIVRSRGALAEIVPALKAAGLRFRAIEIESLGDRQVVQDLFALTRALTHLADRVAWLAILRAPWVGFSLSDFSSHFENRNETVWELVREVPTLERFRAVIGPALANRQRGTLRDRVEGAWLALGGPACLGAEPGDPTALEDAATYLDALEDLEEAGEVDFARLKESLDKLYAQPDLAAGEHDLQIMTIHKAKGLEFDTVIVPGLQRLPGRSDAPLLRWKELPSERGSGSSLLLAPIKETGADDEPAYKYLADLDKEAEDTEAARLLYVAATRAISRLHLMACARPDKNGDIRPPTKRSLLARAWSVAREQFPATLALAVKAGESGELPPQALYRLPADFKLPDSPPPVQWAAPQEGGEEEPLPFDWARETVRHAGTVVHNWLQRMAEQQIQGWDATRIRALRPRFEMELKRRGVSPAELRRGLELVETVLQNALSDERGRWLLGRHPYAQNEHRLRYRGRSLRIDRLFRASDGVVWVVDYKTSPQEGGGIEKFLDQQRERYKAQLDEYAKAVEGARPALYFPLHKGWREWSS